MLSSFVSCVIVLSPLISAHGFITGIKGANGKIGNGFNVNTANLASNRGNVEVFNSQTGCGGANIQQGISTAEAAGLPTAAADGSLSMTWFQLNAGSDGGGPGTASLDTTGTGNNFKSIQITKNFADGGTNSANAMTLVIPPGTACTGGSGSTCLLKVSNPNKFGSCFAVASSASSGAAQGKAAQSGQNSGQATTGQQKQQQKGSQNGQQNGQQKGQGGQQGTQQQSQQQTSGATQSSGTAQQASTGSDVLAEEAAQDKAAAAEIAAAQKAAGVVAGQKIDAVGASLNANNAQLAAQNAKLQAAGQSAGPPAVVASAAAAATTAAASQAATQQNQGQKQAQKGNGRPFGHKQGKGRGQRLA